MKAILRRLIPEFSRWIAGFDHETRIDALEYVDAKTDGCLLWRICNHPDTAPTNC